MDGVALEQAPRVPTTEEDAASPDAGQASKTVASRFYQLRMGHPLIGPYLKKIGKRANVTTPVGGATAELSSLAKSCKKWESILWAEVRRKSKKRKEQVPISELFVEEKCSPAVLDYLISMGVGPVRMREDQDGVSGGGMGGLQGENPGTRPGPRRPI